MRAMKDSGVDWLGEIPAEWPVLPVKAVFRASSSKAHSEDQHLTPSQKFGVLTQVDYMKISGSRVVLQSADSGNMKRVMPGDFISHLRSFQGGLELSTLRGKVSGAYTVLRPIREMESAYFKWALKCDQYIQGLHTTTDQLRDGQTIRIEQLQLLPLPFPSLDEQREIAAYLDQETSQIDTLISKKEQLIEKLLERRQSLITQAVTKGLDPNLPMKDSGVNWFRRIPASFRVEKIKYVSKLKTGASLSDEEKNKFSNSGGETFPYVSSKDVDLDTRKLSLDVDLHIPASSTNYPLANPGSFLMVLEGGSAGRKLCMVEQPVFFVNKLCSFSGEAQEIRWLYYFAQSAPFRQQFEMSLSGLIGGVSATQIGNFNLAIPNEGDLGSLLNFLDRETSQTDRLVSKARKSIEILREKRQALITQVVTGKLDVRGFARGNS